MSTMDSLLLRELRGNLLHLLPVLPGLLRALLREADRRRSRRGLRRHGGWGRTSRAAETDPTVPAECVPRPRAGAAVRAEPRGGLRLRGLDAWRGHPPRRGCRRGGRLLGLRADLPRGREPRLIFAVLCHGPPLITSHRVPTRPL